MNSSHWENTKPLATSIVSRLGPAMTTPGQEFPLDAVWSLIKPHLTEEIGAVMLHCTCGYTTNLLIEDFLKEDNLFATHHDGKPLTPDHGGPLRFVCHHLYALGKPRNG
ncbi:MAG: hypothetical protein Ct9H90mP16_04810 [Candidatus Poseidoniales archaeon]|nr:MAG: hypothetical protein Ct9H90mP16_04810 [Candidatus Poseidoniales archaeon]